MKRTRYRDRLLGVPVVMAIYRWHRVPVFGTITIGKVEGPRPPWHIIVAMIGFEAVSIGSAIWHWSMVYARW